MKTTGYVPSGGIRPRFARRKFLGWWLVPGLVGSFFLAACGGGGSSGPQLELSTETIQATHVLGSAAVVTEIALRNSGDELLTFSLTAPAFWLSAASATNGEIRPGEAATIRFTLECSAPGDVAGSITISGNFDNDANLSASLHCQLPPITLKLSTEAIQTTYVLGSAPVVTEIILINGSDYEPLTFSLTGDPFWLSAANATSGEIGPGETMPVQFILECSTPGDVAGSITISGNFENDASFSASLHCQAPPITVILSKSIPDSSGHPQLNAQSEMQWSIASRWNEQPAVDYTIVSNDERVTVSPASGSVELDGTIVTSLDAACPAPSDQGVELRVTAGDGLLDAIWNVDCQGGSGEVRGVEIYQGPMAIREVYEDDDSEEGGTFQKESFVGLIPGRDSVVTVRVEHETDYLGEPAFNVVDGTGTSHPVETEILSTTDPEESASGNYETEFMFPVARSLFEAESTLRTDIDVDGSDDGPVRKHVLVLNDLAFFDAPLIRIRFFRMENNDGIPNIESLDNFVDALVNYMPTSGVEITVEGIMHHTSGGSWNISRALSDLQDHWLENAEADEYYHGIYIYSDGYPGGVAYLSGKVGLSLDPFSFRDDRFLRDNYVFPHEMGHNFSLPHAPCGGPAGVDPNYPYSEARLGPRRGWKFIENRFIEPDETYYDLMSYCNPTSVSDYNFGKAARYLEVSTRLAVQPPKVLASNASDYVPLTRTGEKAQSLALSGDVDDQGQWSFRRAVYSGRDPFPINLLEVHSHIVKLFDVNGVEVASQSFSPMAITHGTGFGWGVRIAVPASRPVELVVTDLDGIELLRAELEL